MKLKTVEIEGKVYAEVKDGKPVYDNDGEMVAFDAPGTVATISRLNGEAKGHREAKEAAERQLKAFEGIDPEKAKAALDKISKIDAKELVAAGDMDSAIQTALAPVQEELSRVKQEKESLSTLLDKEVVGNAFGGSKFASEKLTPAGVDLIRNLYSSQIKVEDGKPVGYDQNGQKIYSKSRPGELASFDEVVETFVSTYPHKEHIMKGVGASGAGAGAGNSGGAGGSKEMTRIQFNQMSQAERSAKIKEGYKVVDAA